MPVNVLEDYSSNLARQVESADNAAKRTISLAVCRWAVERALPDDPIVPSALAALERDDYGEVERMTALQDHVYDLDDAYFEAQNAGRDFFPLFVKARVANAVLFALDADPFRAATHALYEGCAAFGPDEVEAEVSRVVGVTSGNR
jgi:hypothetical protein